MTRRERLIENYEDAYFALLMEDVIQEEGKRLEELNAALRVDDSVKIPEELDKRCHKTIEQHFSRMQRRVTFRTVRRVLNYAAIIIALTTVLFTTAFAISEDVRVATLNLVFEVTEKYTELRITGTGAAKETTDAESQNAPVYEDYFEGIQIQWLPTGYEYVAGEYDFEAVFQKGNEWIRINKYATNENGVNSVDTEKAEEVKNVHINGMDGLCIVKNGQVHLVLANVEKSYYLDIDASTGVTKEEIKQIAEKLLII